VRARVLYSVRQGTVAFAMAGSGRLSKCVVVLFVCQHRSRVRWVPLPCVTNAEGGLM
jgi:hypothetical protein